VVLTVVASARLLRSHGIHTGWPGGESMAHDGAERTARLRSRTRARQTVLAGAERGGQTHRGRGSKSEWGR